MHIIDLLLTVAVIVIYVFIYKYTLRLDKSHCDCTKQWTRTYIKYYALFAIIVSALNILVKVGGLTALRQIMALILLPVALPAAIVFLVAAFKFYSDTNNNNCACSNGRDKTLLIVWASFGAAMYALLFLSLISALVLHSQVRNPYKPRM
jgi:hypothetical protein